MGCPSRPNPNLVKIKRPEGRFFVFKQLLNRLWLVGMSLKKCVQKKHAKNNKKACQAAHLLLL